MLAVDERAAGTAPVEQACAFRVQHNDRVQPRETVIVDADVGRESPADVRDLLAERDQPRAVFVGEREVPTGWRERRGHRLPTGAVVKE